MIAAYLNAMRNYATFSGRATRREFWLFTLATGVIVFVALVIGDAILSGPDSRTNPFAGLIVLAHLLPGIAVSVRRLHDTDREGWWVLINLIPFGGLVLLLFACQPGTPGPNRFGPMPAADGADRPVAPTSRPAGAIAAQPAPPERRDVIAELERLAQLRASGTLTDAEFEVMKAQALAQSRGA